MFLTIKELNPATGKIRKLFLPLDLSWNNLDSKIRQYQYREKITDLNLIKKKKKKKLTLREKPGQEVTVSIMGLTGSELKLEANSFANPYFSTLGFRLILHH